MYNLRARFCLISLFQVGLFCTLVMFFACGQANEKGSFLSQANQNFNHASSPLLSPSTMALWHEAFSQGYVLRKNQSDKEARPVFVALQAQLEGQMIQAMSPKGTKALWIIHTPLVATPLVTEGALSEHLASAEILAEDPSQRLITSLERAKLIRLFLNRGGFLIVAYSGVKQDAKSGRTPSQLAIYEKLKQQYPSQIIDFPISAEHFSERNYPLDKIGATYFFQYPHGKFEMTNCGFQLNDVRNNATWGVWLHEKQHPNPVVTQRLNEVLAFLNQAGLREKIQQHSQEHQLSKKELISFFN